MILESVMVVTNNPISKEQLNEKHTVDFVEGTTTDVFVKVRDYIHKGHKLLSHPIMSSIKPNQTPYRTVVITKKAYEAIDMQSLTFIEQAIHTNEKFLKNFGVPNWKEQVKEDFAVIDYDLISHEL